MAGELHQISEAIGELRGGLASVLRMQGELKTDLEEKDARDSVAHDKMAKKVDLMFKAYTMGGGIFWLLTLGGILLACVELYDKAVVLFHNIGNGTGT